MKKRGFTLLELTFVISIIAILASILFPVFARARESARKSKCASNLSQIGVALSLYAQNYDGHFPKKNNEFGPLYRYVHNVDLFYCPSDSATAYWELQPMAEYSPGPFGERMVPRRTYSSYVYRGGLSNDDRADTVIAGESQTWHGIANVLHLGGHVTSVPEEAYTPVVKPTQKPVDEKSTPGPGPEPGGPFAPPAPAPMPSPPP